MVPHHYYFHYVHQARRVRIQRHARRYRLLSELVNQTILARASTIIDGRVNRQGLRRHQRAYRQLCVVTRRRRNQSVQARTTIRYGTVYSDYRHRLAGAGIRIPTHTIHAKGVAVTFRMNLNEKHRVNHTAGRIERGIFRTISRRAKGVSNHLQLILGLPMAIVIVNISNLRQVVMHLPFYFRL